MFDVEKILKQLQEKASQVAESVDVDQSVQSAKDIAKKVQTKIETDENARNAAIGGGALLALLMASRGGRKLVGNVAKTGAVAAMGAVAWNAWQNRSQADSVSEEASAESYGFAGDDGADPAFSIAIVESMAAAAHADGQLDTDEEDAIRSALKDGGLNKSVLDETVSRSDVLDRISKAAVTPNHAIQLFAAACVGACDVSEKESDFLKELADKLEIDPRVALRVRRELNV